MNNLSTTIAADINRHHEEACAKADEAISHAIEAGKLLLQVKASLGHGQFLPWVRAHLTVGVRQAQNYIAAAQGKPTPIRSAPNAKQVAHLTDAKPVTQSHQCHTDTSDAVSRHVTQAVEMPADLEKWLGRPSFCPAIGYWHCASDASGGYWIVPSVQHPECFHISRLSPEDETGESFFDGTRRPVPAYMVESYLTTTFGLTDPVALKWSSIQRLGLDRPFGEPEVAAAQRG
jgi:hypothetical protein